MQRIALVTGANKGIGFEIARQIGRANCRVLLGARNPDLGAAAATFLVHEGIDATAIALDVCDPASILAAAATIERDHGRLDILVNNAGIVDPSDAAPGEASLPAVRRIFETNFFGALALSQAVLPLLKRATAARIVNVSSGLGSLTQNGDPCYEFAAYKRIGYNASKAALNMLTVQLAFLLKDQGIKVNAADPGHTATDLNAHRGRQTIPQGAAAAIRLALLPDDGPTGGFFNAAGPVPW